MLASGPDPNEMQFYAEETAFSLMESGAEAPAPPPAPPPPEGGRALVLEFMLDTCPHRT